MGRAFDVLCYASHRGRGPFFNGVTDMEISFGEWMMGFMLLKFIVAALWYEYA